FGNGRGPQRDRCRLRPCSRRAWRTRQARRRLLVSLASYVVHRAVPRGHCFEPRPRRGAQRSRLQFYSAECHTLSTMCFNGCTCLPVLRASRGETAMSVTDRAAAWLDLYDWRKRVSRMYRERTAALRVGESAEAVLERFRAQKNDLFKTHPQSP